MNFPAASYYIQNLTGRDSKSSNLHVIIFRTKNFRCTGCNDSRPEIPSLLLEMLAFFRVSSSVIHCRSITRSPILSCVQTIIPLLLFDLKFLNGPRIDLYHSVNEPEMSKFAVPKRDRSANSNVARSNWMITKLCREGRMGEARQVFDGMCDRDVRLFDRVDAEKNVITWTALVSGYIRLNRIKEAEWLFYKMPVKNVVSWNTMIDGYARNGKTDLALDLFERMPERNVVSWNTIITALAQCGRIDEAKRLFEGMPERDVISWTAMVAGLSRNGRIDEARVLFDRMPGRNVVSWNAMITGYAQNNMLDEASLLFERMPVRDMPSWNTMITGFIQNGELRRAWKLFNEMPQKNVISWTAIITGYIQEGQSEEALKFFSEMLLANEVKPNQGTFVTVLGACSDLAGLREGQQVHQMISKTAYQVCAFVVSALINTYSKCGELGIARKMFDDGLISHWDLVSWNGMIAAYGHHGCGREAIKLFNEMRELGVLPSDVTYVGLLSACSHAGLVEEGLEYFDELVRDGSITVREDHYTCLVDLCGRAGRLNEAFDFIKRLRTKPSASVWGALLAGCNVHGDLNIGKLVAKELSEVELKNAGTYLLLSNIYASAGKWREAAIVRLKMKDNLLKKPPGCSWIEIGKRVHVFVVGDKCHHQSELICSVLCDLHAKMKKVRYVPNDNDLIVDEEFLETQ